MAAAAQEEVSPPNAAQERARCQLERKKSIAGLDRSDRIAVSVEQNTHRLMRSMKNMPVSRRTMLGVVASIAPGSLAGQLDAIARRIAVVAGQQSDTDLLDMSACHAVEHIYDPARIPGGSSGGSAGRSRPRIVPAALGLDTNGSIRCPSRRSAALRVSARRHGQSRTPSTELIESAIRRMAC